MKVSVTKKSIFSHLIFGFFIAIGTFFISNKINKISDTQYLTAKQFLEKHK